MQCAKCGQQINPRRLELIPNTTVCVNCSDVEKYVGFNIYAHKTAGEVVLINPNVKNGKEKIRQAERAYRRSR